MQWNRFETKPASLVNSTQHTFPIPLNFADEGAEAMKNKEKVISSC